MKRFNVRRASTPMVAVVVLLMAGCAGYGTMQGPSAQATIAPTSVAAAAGMKPEGTVRFVQHGSNVMVTGKISGLKPNGVHGFHVHEAADCSGDGLATKGHFNPDGQPHGMHGGGAHHVGDLPALQADANGVASVNFMATKITVAAGAASVVGRGLVIHRDADDYKTQPTGNAGPRPGCAVIKAG